MLDNKRFTVKIGGESGQGINSVGEILAKALKNSGYYIFGYREYPSLIRGGVACYQIDFSNREINSSSESSQILLAISRRTIHEYLKQLSPDGILIHSLIDVRFDKEEEEFIKNNRIKIIYVNAEQEVLLLGGRKIMTNILFLGLLWAIIDLEIKELEEVILQKFANKPEFIEINKKCLQHGFNLQQNVTDKIRVGFYPEKERKGSYVLTGNEALSLGAISAGMRAFYAYPMTPSSSILSYLADTYKSSGVVVRQVEDEITAAQMALGSMYMGTRAMTATSGGGFDLMTETISLSGMTEIPSVTVLAQRPGPATGLPTWTAAADLNLAVYSAHGEFPRCVISVSDAHSSYDLVQRAFNIAEVYQIPVILMTDKQIAESLYNIDTIGEPIPIERGTLQANSSEPKSSDRYKYSDNGISDRWLPGQFEATYNANSDEHSMDGSLTEDSEPTIAIMEKRMRKMTTLKNELPEPVLYGDTKADITIVGWGSSKSVILDVLKILSENSEGGKANYLHYEFLYPLKTSFLEELLKKNKRIALIENNYLGQLGNLIRMECGVKIEDKDKLLKYDGRPFFIEEVYNFIKRL